MSMIKPQNVQPGDTIGIITPGSPLEASVIDSGVQTLKDLGFNVVLGRHVYAEDGFLAGTDRERAYELMEMFANDQVTMILPARGGVGVAGILPYLDYDFIRAHPKVVSGYSDVTILLNTLAQKSGLITFHSLLLVNFTGDEPEYNYNQFFSTILMLSFPERIQNPQGMRQISKVQGNAVGPIAGGNLTSVAGALGTPFEVDTLGKILLLEGTNEPVNTIYRYLNALSLAGKFDDCIGIVMGQCSGCSESYNTTYEDLIEDFLVPLGKPLMTNVATGHGTYKAAIPIGATAHLDTVNNTLTVLGSNCS